VLEQARDPLVGSVADEAARLIGLFSAGMPDAAASEAGARASARSRPSVCPTCGHDGSAAAADSVCGACPVCQLIGFVKAVSPDAIERLADVVDLVGDGLRAFAASRRPPTPGPAPSAPGEPHGSADERG
jgi:hypothetical protein